jgi:hypothetical protein
LEETLSEISQGLSLSGIGILVTFSALGILVLLILLLKLVFPARGVDHSGSISGKEIDPREALKEQAAAVAVAALLDQDKGARKSSLGALLEEGRSNWWKRGVDRGQGKEIK